MASMYLYTFPISLTSHLVKVGKVTTPFRGANRRYTTTSYHYFIILWNLCQTKSGVDNLGDPGYNIDTKGRCRMAAAR